MTIENVDSFQYLMDKRYWKKQIWPQKKKKKKKMRALKSLILGANGPSN